MLSIKVNDCIRAINYKVSGSFDSLSMEIEFEIKNNRFIFNNVLALIVIDGSFVDTLKMSNVYIASLSN